MVILRKFEAQRIICNVTDVVMKTVSLYKAKLRKNGPKLLLSDNRI